MGEREKFSGVGIRKGTMQREIKKGKEKKDCKYKAILSFNWINKNHHTSLKIFFDEYKFSTIRTLLSKDLNLFKMSCRCRNKDFLKIYKSISGKIIKKKKKKNNTCAAYSI